MAAGRIYPENSNVELGISSFDYHGSVGTTIATKSMNVPSKNVTKNLSSSISWHFGTGKESASILSRQFEEPIDNEKIKDMSCFIRQHFKRKECVKFVPKPDQTTGPKAVKKIKELKCHCGETLEGHTIPKASPTKSSDMLIIVPEEYKSLMSYKNWENAIPAYTVPSGAWNENTDLQSTPTNAFGKINFENVEHVGGKKPAKYVRMSADDSVDDLITLMIQHWKMMEPEKPRLAISVVGGAKNFKLDKNMRETFSSGLIKAAKATNAWMISTGFNMGVMKAVGQAVHEGQSFCWDNDRMVHKLRCIGIAPWGYMRHRSHLENKSSEDLGMFIANYRTSNVIMHDAFVPLNPDHTHFIFVDDGIRMRYDVGEVRAKLEQKISQPETARGLGIPVVLILIEGGVESIMDVSKSLEHNIPVVVCAGTKRAADILAYAYTHVRTGPGRCKTLNEKYRKKLLEKIKEAYAVKMHWKENGESDTKAQEIVKNVLSCCERSELLTVFHMHQQEGLDLAILSVLLKAKTRGNEESRLNQLKLALTWNRVDIVQEEIFGEDVVWSTGSLDVIMTEALKLNRVHFVELLLQQGVVMKEYLTVEVLEELYREIPKHDYLYKVLHKIIGKEELTLNNICDLMKHLLDHYDPLDKLLLPSEQNKQTEQSGYNNKKLDDKKRRFDRPYQMLFIWALLSKRQTLAKLIWKLGDEPVTSALVAARIFFTLSKNLPKHESHQKVLFREYGREFESLATSVLDKCHQNDPEKAMMIVDRPSPCWDGMTCLQIAAVANVQEFLSSVTCQNYMNYIWKLGMLFSFKNLFVALICPPYIAYGLEFKTGEERIGWLEKLVLFYSSPLVKFSYGTLSYIVFLCLHTYMLLVDFNPDRVTVLEWVMTIWVLSFFLDEIYTFIAFRAPTIRAKLRDWFSLLKIMYLLNCLMAFTGFIVHWFPQYYYVTKELYCINSIIFYMRILKLYIANGTLGPKIFMIQKMVAELLMFVAVLAVFLFAYGIASQGLLYHSRSPTWKILKDTVYSPYFRLFGELFLDELETDKQCEAKSINCRTYHWMVPFLLAAYLMLGSILLLNLLIAIFSNVFKSVEGNSIKIWKYQMYFLTIELQHKTELVPPLSLIQHCVLIPFSFITKLCFKKKRTDFKVSKRHLEYLQLFEKEMLLNHLRQMQETSDAETTIHELNKRLDALTEMIEDELLDKDIEEQQQSVGDKTVNNINAEVEIENTDLRKRKKKHKKRKHRSRQDDKLETDYNLNQTEKNDFGDKPSIGEENLNAEQDHNLEKGYYPAQGHDLLQGHDLSFGGILTQTYNSTKIPHKLIRRNADLKIINEDIDV